MRVTILGSGTAIPVPDRFPSGVLIEAGAEKLLLDIGPGTLRRLAQTGIGLEEISTVLLTHYHTDHTGDLAALLFALRSPTYAGRPPLRLIGHAGLATLLGHLTAAWPWLEPRGYPLEVEELGTDSFAIGTFSIGALSVTAVPIRHTKESLAYRIEEPGGATVALSGDADVCDGLVEVARDADLFICDCAFPDSLRTQGHLTPRLAGEHAARAGVKTLCLTHFYPECEGHDLRAQAQAAFAGEIVLAEDLMVFRLRHSRVPSPDSARRPDGEGDR